MDILLAARSMRRSNLRTRIVLRLAQRRRAFPALLAEDVDVDCRDLRRAMHGSLPHYSPALSPIHLGIVRRARKRRGEEEYIITAFGLRVAREMRRLRGRRDAADARDPLP